MNEIEKSFERLMRVMGFRYEKEIAGALGLSPRALAGRKKGGSIEKELRALAQQRPELGIDVNYILTGERTPQTCEVNLTSQAQPPENRVNEEKTPYGHVGNPVMPVGELSAQEVRLVTLWRESTTEGRSYIMRLAEISADARRRMEE